MDPAKCHSEKQVEDCHGAGASGGSNWSSEKDLQSDEQCLTSRTLVKNQADYQAPAEFNPVGDGHYKKMPTKVIWSTKSKYHKQSFTTNSQNRTPSGLQRAKSDESFCNVDKNQNDPEKSSTQSLPSDTSSTSGHSVAGGQSRKKQRRNRQHWAKYLSESRARTSEQESVPLEQSKQERTNTIVQMKNEVVAVSASTGQIKVLDSNKEQQDDILQNHPVQSPKCTASAVTVDSTDWKAKEEDKCSQEDGLQQLPQCESGSRCSDADCRYGHPKGWTVCHNGVNCCEFNCQAVHPEGRTPKCTKATQCNNIHCEYLHPSEWSPSNQSGSTSLKTTAERQADQKRAALPIWKSKTEFIKRLLVDRVIVVKAQTGSGKTTQLSQYAADGLHGLVICTQPRVIAAISIAQRIAFEYDGTSVGHNVGYRAGGQSVDGRKIMVVTDAALIRMAQSDRKLKKVGALIIDEAHERSLNTDIVTGIAKEVCQQRPLDFKVVISSATIDPKPFMDFFRSEAPKRMPQAGAHDILTATVLEVPGAVFPVTMESRPMTEDLEAGLAREVSKTLREHQLGHCLVFLPGSREVDRAIAHFKKVKEPHWIPLPLYGSLPQEDQNRVLQFDDRQGALRMVVFCTNVAETSLTVPDVRLVIDTGLAKEARYDTVRRTTVLEQVYISRSSADQRKGRAGRTAEGHCIRLFQPEMLTRERVTPEILRSSLDLVTLQLCALGHNPLTFDLIDRPDEAAMKSSIELLQDIGCITQSLKLTDRGQLFSTLPFDPRMSHFVLVAHEVYGMKTMAAEIASILSAPGSIIFFGRSGQAKPALENMPNFTSDLLHRLTLYQKWVNAGKVHGQGLTITCLTCRRTVSRVSAQRDGGCRPCRVDHSNANSLNNKTLDIVRKTVPQVVTAIEKWKTTQSPSVEAPVDLEEVIGRCLAWAFPEQVGEFLVPNSPELGVHLLFSNTKGHLSNCSTFVLPRGLQVRFLLPMSLTRVPSGRLLLDKVHRMELDWLPTEERSKAQKSSLGVVQCYSRNNLSSRYSVKCSSQFQNLTNSGDDQSGFVVLQYSALDTTVTVYAPRSYSERAAQFCKDQIGQLLQEDLNQSVIVECCNGTAQLTIGTGLEVVRIEPIAPSCRVPFQKPPVKSNEEFLKWVCEICNGAPSDVKWWRYHRSRHDGFSAPAPPCGVAVFHDEAIAKRARDYNADQTEGATRGCALLVKLTTDSVEEVLNSYKFKPVKIVRKRSLTTQHRIKISNIPAYLNDHWLREFISALGRPRFIRNTAVVNDSYNSLVVFDDVDTRDHVLSTLLETPVLHGQFTITVPSRRKASGTRDIEVRTELFADTLELPAEFILVFKNRIEADDLYRLKVLQGLVSVDGFSTVRVDHREKYSLDKHVQSVAKRYGTKHRCVKLPNAFKVVFWGGKPSTCQDAAQDLRKVLAPIRYVFRGRDKHIMGQELHQSKTLESWAKDLDLHLDNLDVDGQFIGFVVHGERYRQGQFMARLADYYGSFVDRYHSIGLPPSSGHLFRKGGLGASHLSKLNSEGRADQCQMAFVHFSNAIEIVVSPAAVARADQIVTDRKAAIEKFLERCHQPRLVAKQCAYCHGSKGSPFEICGHYYCKECLAQSIRFHQSRLLEDLEAESPQDDHQGHGPLCCPTCQTMISIKDITSCLEMDILEELGTILARWHVSRMDDKALALCPAAECQGLISKSGGYGPCPVCGTEACPECRTIDDDRHRGKTCKEYVQLLEGRTVAIAELEEMVRQFAKDQWELYCKANHGRIWQIELNPGLQNGCRALQLYCTGLDKFNVRDLRQCAIFAWHGTNTEAGLAAICNEGFDPSLRSGQAHGPGEYFGISPDTSMHYAANINRLIVVQLIKIPSIVTEIPNFCYVVNNPLDRKCSYNLPVAVISYGKNKPPPIGWILGTKQPLPSPFREPEPPKKPEQNVQQTRVSAIYVAPLPVPNDQKAQTATNLPVLDISNDPVPEPTVPSSRRASGCRHVDPNHSWKSPFCWKWMADGAQMSPYPSDISATIEKHYDNFRWRSGAPSCDIPNVVRNVDRNLQTYTIDFISMLQINKATQFCRKVQRCPDVTPDSGVADWKYCDTLGGTWETFVQEAGDQTEGAFTKYISDGGPGRVILSIGRFNYQVNFISGFQKNLTTYTKRQIERSKNTTARRSSPIFASTSVPMASSTSPPSASMTSAWSSSGSSSFNRSTNTMTSSSSSRAYSSYITPPPSSRPNSDKKCIIL